MSAPGFAPLSRVLPYWPTAAFGQPDFLDEVGVDRWSTVEDTSDTLRFKGALLWARRIALTPPILPGFTVALLPDAGLTRADLTVQLRPQFQVELEDLALELQLAASLLRPVDRDGNRWVPAEGRSAVIRFDGVGVVADLDGNFRLTGAPSGTLEAVTIGDSGLVLEGREIGPADGGGLRIGSATLYFPEGIELPAVSAGELTLGGDGISGDIALTPSAPVDGHFFGMGFVWRTGELSLRQNVPIAFALEGDLTLPFFEQPVGVRVSIGAAGTFAVALTATTTIRVAEVLEIEPSSLALQMLDGQLALRLSGKLRPLVDIGGAWPTFDVRDLVISADGEVQIAGGWLDLPRQQTLDFHGFHVEVSRIALGHTDDGGDRWLALDARVRLNEALPVGVSVEGLRLVWSASGAARVEWRGMGVTVELPGAVRLEGEVEFDPVTSGFAGHLRADITAIDLHLDAQCTVARGDFSVVIDTSFAAGIPLLATGLGIYGFSGLFTLGRRPGRAETEGWYDWYATPPRGVTSLAEKWEPSPSAIGFGAGITLGTLADNGFAFSGRLLLVLSFPGPVLLLEGKADILSGRVREDQDAPFSALAVLDLGGGSALIAVDAAYRFNPLIEIHAGVEAYFGGPDDWHLYLGQREPREKRVRARLFDLLEVAGYLMLDSHSLATGAWLGWDEHFRFGPVSLDTEAWIDGNVELSWRPVHFHGDLWIHGRLALHVFGIGFGISLDAQMAADVFDPFHLLLAVSIGLELPWPLPDIDVGFTLEWGPDRKIPPLPLPLQQVALEHLKVSTTWPLPRVMTTLDPDHASWNLPPMLRPDYERGRNGLRTEPDVPPETLLAAGPPPGLPVVPIDALPRLTFARPVLDVAAVGVNAQPAAWQWIGDPSKGEGPLRIQHRLLTIVLSKWTGEGWKDVAGRGRDELAPLHGSWDPIPSLGASEESQGIDQTKLWLWSNNPFDHTNYGGEAWDDWVQEHLPDYPCIAVPSAALTCYDFDNLEDEPLRPPWRHPDQPKLMLIWTPALEAARSDALCFRRVKPETGLPVLAIILPRPTYQATLKLRCAARTTVTGFDGVSGPLAPQTLDPGEHSLTLAGAPLFGALLRSDGVCIERVCISQVSPEEVAAAQQQADHIRSAAAGWAQTGHVFDPFTTYRLMVQTETEAIGAGELSGYHKTPSQTEYAYFRTEGPPGLERLSVPGATTALEEVARYGDDGALTLIDDRPVLASQLDDLGPYVATTTPVSPTPSAPRPIHRAYDLHIAFNEDYVEAMYRGARRALGVVIFDTNGNRVGAAEPLRWTDGEARSGADRRWLSFVAESDCLAIDPAAIPACDAVSVAVRGGLSPTTLYQAQLAPLLLSDDFDAHPTQILGRTADEGWQADHGSAWVTEKQADSPAWMAAPSLFQVNGSSTGLRLIWMAPAPLRATEDPSKWSDYLVSVRAGLSLEGAAGLVFRRRSQHDFYLFLIATDGRRLLRVAGGRSSTLAADEQACVRGRAYRLSVEVSGARFRAYQDGALAFEVEDGTHPEGTVGLCSWGQGETWFSDVQVEDRRGSLALYRFSFVTSRFATLFHHLHGHTGEALPLPMGGGTDEEIASWLRAAVPLAAASSSASEMETSAFQRLAETALGSAARRRPNQPHVIRLERGGDAIGWIVRCPEPITWPRVNLTLAYSSHRGVAPAASGAVKITDLVGEPASLRLLLRETALLAGHRVEYRLAADFSERPDSLAEWITWYTFAEATPLPDGTRIWIDAADERAPEAEDMAAIRRRARTDGPSASERVEIRVVAPDGSLLHQRQMAPSSSFSPVSGARLLRKADGTAFAILGTAGGSLGALLTAGDHRLQLVFQRGPSAADPTSETISEMGATDPERIVLDIAWNTPPVR